MLEKETIAKGLEIRYTGVADIDDLYETVKDWLNMMDYGDEKKSFIESEFKQQIQGEARNMEIEWSSEKRIDPFVSFMINVRFNFKGIVDAEIKNEDRTIHTNRGDFRIWIDGVMIKDPENKWNDLIKGIYERFIIKSRLDNYRADLYNKVYALQKTIKGFFNLRE